MKEGRNRWKELSHHKWNPVGNGHGSQVWKELGVTPLCWNSWSCQCGVQAAAGVGTAELHHMLRQCTSSAPLDLLLSCTLILPQCDYGLSCPSIFICFMFKNFNRMSFNRISSISYLAENIACIVETPWSGLLLSSHAQVRFFRDSFEGGKAMGPKMLTWEASNFIGMLWNLFSLINTSLWKRLSKVSTKSSQIWE